MSIHRANKDFDWIKSVKIDPIKHDTYRYDSIHSDETVSKLTLTIITWFYTYQIDVTASLPNHHSQDLKLLFLTSEYVNMTLSQYIHSCEIKGAEVIVTMSTYNNFLTWITYGLINESDDNSVIVYTTNEPVTVPQSGEQ
jgi:hypothetical protein